MRIILSSCKKYRAVQQDDDIPLFEIIDRNYELVVGHIKPLSKVYKDHLRMVFYPVKESFFTATELMDISCLITTCRIAHTGIDYLSEDEG